MERINLKRLLILSKSEFEKVKVKQDNIPFCQFHKHDYVEVVYFYKGSGVHIVDDERCEVKSGDLFLIPGGVGHKFTGDDLCKVNLMFDPEFIDKDIGTDNFISDFCDKFFKGNEFIDRLKKQKYIHISNFTGEDGKIDIFDILQEYNVCDIGYERVLLCKVEIFLVNVFRKYIESVMGLNVQSMHKKTVGKAVIYIDEHLPDIKKSSDVANKIGYNAVYFNRIFSEYRGMSIACYLRKKKMEYACKLLVETDYTIEKICEIAGYSDLKNFYKSFKSAMGVTPNEYRRGRRE